MEHKDTIAQLLNDKLSQVPVPPPEEAWGQMERLLVQPRPWWWSWLQGLLSTVVLVGALAVLFYSQTAVQTAAAIAAESTGLWLAVPEEAAEMAMRAEASVDQPAALPTRQDAALAHAVLPEAAAETYVEPGPPYIPVKNLSREPRYMLQPVEENSTPDHLPLMAYRPGGSLPVTDHAGTSFAQGLERYGNDSDSSMARDIWCQDPVRANTYDASILFHFWDNPAYAGTEERHNLHLQTTRQWFGLYEQREGITRDISSRRFYQSPTTMRLGYDGAWGKQKQWGVGAFIWKDLYQFREVTAYNLSLAYQLVDQDAHRLKLGAGLSYVDEDFLDGESFFDGQLLFGDQIDPRTGPTQGLTRDDAVAEQVTRLNLSAGLWYQYRGAYAGVSFDQLNRADASRFTDVDYQLPVVMRAQAGFRYALPNPTWMLHPT
ncbi:MAG: type IX secretion system membrane protein PorP/SprF, partial [Bacteroidota bacterium]